MTTIYSDDSDLLIPSFDTDAKTVELAVEVHPGQAKLLDFLVDCEHLAFRNRADVVRWCIAFGVHTLLGGVPSGFALLEAKMNVLHYERWNNQKDCLTDSVAKSLAHGERENARRLVVLAFEEYSHIPIPYWKQAWLSTLEPAIEMLRQHGIRFPWASSIEGVL